MAFSEEYLKDYKRKIDLLTEEELYEILQLIRDHPFKADNSPERIKIVEKRIIELTGDKDSILPRVKYNRKIEEAYSKKTTPAAKCLKITGFILLIISGTANVVCISVHNDFTPSRIILCGLGCLLWAIGDLLDGQTKLHLGGWSVVWTKDDYPKHFWIITGIFLFIGLSLIFYGISLP